MRRISEFSANASLKHYYQTICDAAREGYSNYVASPETMIHSARTMACAINDQIWAELVNRLDGSAEPVFDKRRNLRFLKFGRRQPILLWLKKVSLTHKYNRVETSVEDKTDHSARLAQGQTELFPSAQILALGYRLSPDRARVGRVSITPTFDRNEEPAWWIDLVMLPVIGINNAKSRHNYELEIKRSSHQRRLGA